jgi:hypothetical protein
MENPPSPSSESIPFAYDLDLAPTFQYLRAYADLEPQILWLKSWALRALWAVVGVLLIGFALAALLASFESKDGSVEQSFSAEAAAALAFFTASPALTLGRRKYRFLLGAVCLFFSIGFLVGAVSSEGATQALLISFGFALITLGLLELLIQAWMDGLRKAARKLSDEIDEIYKQGRAAKEILEGG